MRTLCCVLCAEVAGALTASELIINPDGRNVISLNGTWQIIVDSEADREKGLIGFRIPRRRKVRSGTDAVRSIRERKNAIEKHR